MNVLRATSCKLKRPTNYTDAFCAISPNRETPCFGDGGGPLIDRNGKLVGLYMPDMVDFGFDTTCPANRPKVFTRLSGSKLKWIQDSLCKFSDFSSNFTFCPDLICPPDLILLQDDNSTTMGGAFLPQVNGSLLKPALTNVTQFPLVGKPRREGTSTMVTVTGTNPLSNQTLSCQWRVTVKAISADADGWIVQFVANKGNTDFTKTYNLQYPVVGKFFGVGTLTFFYSYAMAPSSSLTVTFKRINNSNSTDSAVLQTVRIRGNNIPESILDLVENPVTFPDYTNRYEVQVKARGFKQRADVLFFLFAQEKKLVA